MFMKPMKLNLRVELRLGEDNYYLGVTGGCYLGPNCLRVVLFGEKLSKSETIWGEPIKYGVGIID